MRLVYCIGSLGQKGGAERVLVNKANFLADIGYDVTILIAKQNKKAICYEVSENVKILDLDIEVSKSLSSKIPVLGFFLNIRKLKKIYKKIFFELNSDIILNIERGYEDFIIPKVCNNFITIREAHSSKAAVQVTDSGDCFFSIKHLSNKYYTYLYKKQLKKYDKVVLLTKQDSIDRKYKNGDKVIPNLVSSFDMNVTYNYQSKKVISVGRLDKYKNFKDQIIVWKAIAKSHPDWSLHIYGDGPEKTNLDNQIKDLKLENSVFLEGIKSNIEAQYANSSFFIFTSLAEGFGMVLVEAMQMGLPVISYNCPCGPAEIIEEAKDGFLIEISDLKTLEKKILFLIENENERKNMSANAIEKSTKFLPESIMPQWIDLFQELKNGK